MALGKQVSVGTTPTLLNSGDQGWFAIGLITGATQSVFLGGATVTTATGYELAAGKNIVLPSVQGDPIYGIVAATTQRCDVLEVD